jgi:hypothetical protein
MSNLQNCRECGSKVELVVIKSLNAKTNRYDDHTYLISCPTGCFSIESISYDATLLAYETINDAEWVEERRQARIDAEQRAREIESVIEAKFTEAGHSVTNFPSVDVDKILQELGNNVRKLILERDGLY